jgi:hypothetical protein
VCDEEAIGVSSIFKAIRSAAAWWPPVVFVYQSIIKSIQFLFIMKRQSGSYIKTYSTGWIYEWGVVFQTYWVDI